jgi:hypothetical protein
MRGDAVNKVSKKNKEEGAYELIISGLSALQLNRYRYPQERADWPNMAALTRSLHEMQDWYKAQKGLLSHFDLLVVSLSILAGPTPNRSPAPDSTEHHEQSPSFYSRSFDRPFALSP